MASVPLGDSSAYRAALEGNWRRMREFFEEHKEQVQIPFTLSGDCALHIAVYSRKREPLGKLLGMEEDYHSKEEVLQSLVMKTNYFGNTVLHEAVLTGNFEAVKLLMMDGYRELSTTKNDAGETPLFLAASCADIEIVNYLLRTSEQLDPIDLPDIHRRRTDGTSILHAAIHGENFETALLLLELDPGLKDLKDGNNKTALQYLAAMPSAFESGYSMDILRNFIYFCAPVEDEKKTTPRNSDIETGSSRNQNQHYQSMCSCVATVLQKVNLALWTYLLEELPMFREPWKKKKKHIFASRLAKLLIKDDLSWYTASAPLYLEEIKHGVEKTEENRQLLKPDKIPLLNATRDGIAEIVEILKTSSGKTALGQQQPQNKEGGGGSGGIPLLNVTRSGIAEIIRECKKEEEEEGEDDKAIPLFLATRNGILEIVQGILTEYPQAVEYINNGKQNILHLAVLHRQKDVFHFVRKLRIPLARLKKGIDKNDYTLLHQAADTKHYSGETKPGPVLGLQEELELFEQVRESIPGHYVTFREKKHNRTAEELFAEKHNSQLKDARDWTNGTCASCSTVAVLIAGLAFAGAFTVPGDLNDEGIPRFLCSNYFMVFAIMDVVSLASSLTSVVMFLSATTSPLGLKDFRRSIPWKLMLGLQLLFFSVVTTVVAFGVSVLILLHSEKLWTYWLVYIAAFFPVLVFVAVQGPIYIAFLETATYSLIPPSALLLECVKERFRQF